MNREVILRISRKNRYVLLALLLPILFYSVENLRGHLALQQYFKDCRANGEWFEESERAALRPEGGVNLFDLPGAKAGLTGDGIFDLQVLKMVKHHILANAAT